MRRIVKKQQDTPETTADGKKQWKFCTALEFMKKDIEEDLKEKVEMTDEEKSSLIEFYKNSPQLWDPSLREYRDRDQRRALLEKLSLEYQNKYHIKTISETWQKLSAYYQREYVKQENSKKSGSGRDDVYVSDWPFFKSLEFLSDTTEPDMGVSTTCRQHLLPPITPKRKREEEKENAMEATKLKVLEALVSKLTDTNTSSSSAVTGTTWKSAYEDGFQAGFQAGYQQCLVTMQQTFQPVTSSAIVRYQGRFNHPLSNLQSPLQLSQTVNYNQNNDWAETSY